ncbi:MAG TPA: hypothetical protein VN948_11650 [Terriglobales bacterium]|nr:hypothetical protein [Terriglobales bacterium]
MKYVSRKPLVYLLPLLHFCACITIKVADLESGVHYLILVDFPFSFLLVMLGWRRDNFLLWFSTLGTLWWYFLSYLAQQTFDVFAASRRR